MHGEGASLEKRIRVQNDASYDPARLLEFNQQVAILGLNISTDSQQDFILGGRRSGRGTATIFAAFLD